MIVRYCRTMLGMLSSTYFYGTWVSVTRNSSSQRPAPQYLSLAYILYVEKNKNFSSIFFSMNFFVHSSYEIVEN
jgi:hypothetical protein